MKRETVPVFTEFTFIKYLANEIEVLVFFMTLWWATGRGLRL